ncbi:MAG TPA: PAS domain S-box protein [Balneolaceae bacterium]|nr:PAS domain S-box protein [Balneolaceae bacterium]
MYYSIKDIKILLIEDNPGDGRLIQEYLKDPAITFQANIDIEKNLEKGIHQLRRRQYDIILLDLSLPDSSGLVTLEKVRNVAGPIPIVVLTGLDDEEIGFEAVHKGAQDFLTKKEINVTVLSRAVLYAIERSQLLQKLKKSEGRLRQAQQLAHIGSFEHNLKSGEFLWSEEVFRLLELEPGKRNLKYDDFWDMIHQQDREDFDEAIKRVHKNGKRQYIEFRVQTYSGNIKHLYSILEPIRTNDNNIVKIFGTTHDITQRKKTEQQLKENERRYRMLFQATTDEILVFQLDDNMDPLPFIEVNDVACNILGYSREELLQKTLYDIAEADDGEIKRRINGVINFGATLHDSKHVTKKGNIIPLEISARSFLYEGQQTIISIGRDIRARQKLEQEILNISERERQRIGRDMHDDLGQMLTGIGMIAQNLANRLKANRLPAADDVQEIADLVKEADEHARSLARGLVPVNVESNGLSSALQELAEKRSKMFNINIKYTSKQADEIKNSSSAVHLYRIAQEAINNAVKHGEATFIDVELSVLEDHVLLTVKDNGKGFSEARQKSDGMGVRIMNFRANMIGGNLKINSEPGKGTEIICKIPTKNSILI